MRHLMPIVTPRLILRPPALGDLDSIQTAKEEAWPDLQRWMTWAFENQRSRQAMEDSIRRVMDYQNQAGIALAGCQSCIEIATASITVQKPTSAAITQNVKKTYANQTWTSCDGGESLANRYGYRRCVQYQVKDQKSPPGNIQQVLSIHEDVAVVDSNFSSNSHSGDTSTNAVGIFQDELALLGTSALPTTACSIVKQSFTATGNSSPIRVNCIRYSSTDVVITDVTSNPAQCSQPTYHCN